MRFGSLFSGIGGMDLGLEWAGMECAWQVENDSYAVRVLEKHWPNVTRYGDIREVDFGGVEPVELLAGGFPCQDLSYAGKGLGLSGERSGLWSEFKRAIRMVGPRYVLVENVPGLLGRGMGAVLGDLASLGYDAEWQSIPAAAFGAPHLRWRIFIVGYAQRSGRVDSATHDGEYHAPRETGGSEAGRNSLAPEASSRAEVLAYAQRAERRQGESARYESDGTVARWPQAAGWTGASRPHGGAGHVAHADGERREGWCGAFWPRRWDEPAHSRKPIADPDESGLEERYGGERASGPRPSPLQQDWWAVEPNVGRVAHVVPSRVDRLRGLGNAVVPQVAEYIGRCILEADRRIEEAS